MKKTKSFDLLRTNTIQLCSMLFLYKYSTYGEAEVLKQGV